MAHSGTRHHLRHLRGLSNALHGVRGPCFLRGGAAPGQNGLHQRRGDGASRVDVKPGHEPCLSYYSGNWKRWKSKSESGPLNGDTPLIKINQRFCSIQGQHLLSNARNPLTVTTVGSTKTVIDVLHRPFPKPMLNQVRSRTN